MAMAFVAHRWADLTHVELTQLAARDAVAVLVTAAVEQHGAHLPLSTDVDIGEGLLAAALARLASGEDERTVRPLLILPTLAIGASLEHTGFAGTLSLAPEAAIAQIEAIGAGLARTGVRRLVLVNSHGGNKAVLDLAALKLRAAHAMLAVKANYFRFAPPEAALPARELAHGLHGGALETALMLHFAPHKVRTAEVANAEPLGARLADAGARLAPEGDAAFAWMAQDLHAGGAAGDARLATAETGARLADRFAERLAEVIAEAAAFDLEALRAGDAG